jgi:hypothetical protein
MEQKIDKIHDNIVELKISVAKQGECVSSIDDRVDKLESGFSNMQGSILSEANKNASFWRSKLVAVIISVVLGGGVIGGIMKYTAVPAQASQHQQEIKK